MRQLLAQERPLVSHLFAAAGLPFDPEALMVTPMSDGGMGSLALGTGYEARKMGRQVAECHFVDKDEVLVSATLNVDTQGDPYEVDMWKGSCPASWCTSRESWFGWTRAQLTTADNRAV
jgi:hypothetical protein